MTNFRKGVEKLCSAARPTDLAGRKTRRVEDVIALQDTRAGFEPFRARGIRRGPPNTTGFVRAVEGFKNPSFFAPPDQARCQSSEKYHLSLDSGLIPISTAIDFCILVFRLTPSPKRG
jgi:hypothetical protein